MVYDWIGKLTFAASLDCLRPRGIVVSFGVSNGAPDPVSVGTLNAKGSLFLTRPGLEAHATELGEYHRRVSSVSSAVISGVIKPETWRVFALSDAAVAHCAVP